MFKKNSILDRPVRPPSARNVENGPIEFQQQQEKDAARFDKYRRHEEMKGYSCRNQWEDPQHWETTSYEKTHRLQTVVTENGLETVPRADVDVLSGVMKIPAPWDRLPENYDERAAAAADYPPYSPAPRPYSPAAGTPHRLLHKAEYYVPEDDPALVPITQRRRASLVWRRPVELPKKLDGTYNPITHQWTVPPSDAREMDREAMPPGQEPAVYSHHHNYARALTRLVSPFTADEKRVFPSVTP